MIMKKPIICFEGNKLKDFLKKTLQHLSLSLTTQIMNMDLMLLDSPLRLIYDLSQSNCGRLCYALNHEYIYIYIYTFQDL